MASNLFFYHGPTGRGAYYELKLDPKLVQRASWETLAKTWTRIVPVQTGYEASAKRMIADLFCYDASAGRGDFYRIDNAGTCSAPSAL